MKREEFKKIRWIRNQNPVLRPGEKGSWDCRAAITPSIYMNEGKYCMFYTGQGYGSNDWGIGIAESNDLIRWVKTSDKALIQDNKNMDLYNIDGASLIFSGKYNLFFESKSIQNSGVGNLFKRFIPYQAFKYLIAIKSSLESRKHKSMALRHAYGRRISMCESTDIHKWDVKKSNAVLLDQKEGWDNKGVFSPRVFKVGNKFFLIYGGSDGNRTNTGIAVSSNLKIWRRASEHPVLQHGNAQDWDQNHALIVDIVELEDGYAGFYEGEDKHNQYNIGIAFSQDLKKWEKFSGNPVFGVGPKGSFDEKMVCSPHVIEKDSKYFLFYSGHNRYMEGCCGLARGEL